MSTVYALIDPITNEARYIGITVNNLALRLYGHCKSGSNGVEQWVSSLNGAKPEIIALEEDIPIERENEAEIFWIAYFKSLGANLLNVHIGGKHSTRPPQEKSSMIMRAIKFDDEKWDRLVELGREKGTTAAALIREAVYSMLKREMTPTEETP